MERTSRSAPTPPSTAAPLDDTVIEEGVKLDNLVQIGHNVHIGAHSALAACVGLAAAPPSQALRSAAAPALRPPHIADDVVITGYSAVTHSIASRAYIPAPCRSKSTRLAAGWLRAQAQRVLGDPRGAQERATGRKSSRKRNHD